MAIGGERFEAHNKSVISVGGGGSDIEAMDEELPLADGLTNQSIERALGRFAEAAASSPTVSRIEQAAEHSWVWWQCGGRCVGKPQMQLIFRNDNAATLRPYKTQQAIVLKVFACLFGGEFIFWPSSHNHATTIFLLWGYISFA